MGRKILNWDEKIPQLAHEALMNNPDYSIALKLEAIAACENSSIQTVANQFNVQRQTIKNWIDRFASHGPKGLRRKPHSRRSKLTGEQKETILNWLRNQKDPNGNTIRWTLKELQFYIHQCFGVYVGITSIWLWLNKEGLSFKSIRRRTATLGGTSQASHDGLGEGLKNPS
jgi:transposase